MAARIPSAGWATGRALARRHLQPRPSVGGQCVGYDLAEALLPHLDDRLGQATYGGFEPVADAPDEAVHVEAIYCLFVR